jgi:hypothetical protein
MNFSIGIFPILQTFWERTSNLASVGSGLQQQTAAKVLLNWSRFAHK